MRRRSTPIAPDTVVAGRYRVEETLGQGGMGVVFAALDETENIRVALKLLDDAQLGDDKMVARFFREATAAAQVDSVHVARVFGHGRLEDGRPYIVSELLRGHDLARYLTRTNVPVDDVVDFVRQACRGLEAVHRAGIIHRDLKPANLYLALDGSGRQTVKILDFGICKLQDRASGQSLTREADVLGTPLYMPPEQLVSSRDVDARADIWSLGVILYEILTGRPPFVGASFTELTEAIVGREPPPIRALRPDVSPELAAVIDRCLAKHRADRFPSATALERALTFFTGDETETSVRIEEPRPPTMKLDDEPRPPTMKLEEPEPGVTPSTLKLASGGPEAGAAKAVRSARALVRGVGGEVPDAEKKSFGRYVMYRPLASGGMGSVFYAVSRADDGALTSVAIKQVRADVTSEERVTMLADEARIVGSIRHPNVVGVLDVIVESGVVMLAMPLVIGASLQQVRRAAEAEGRPFPPAVASAIVIDVLAGIQAAHEARDRFGQPLEIIHRDISPHNVLVDASGVSLVTDFGVAFARGRLQRSTETGTLKGKVGYLAPEQIHGKPTQATDLYAAGAVYWELLTGEPLFDGSDAEMLAAALLGRIDPPSTRAPGVPPALDAVVLRSLARAPEDRFRSAREMADAIAQAAPVATHAEVAAWLEATSGDAIAAQRAVVDAMMREAMHENGALAGQAPPLVSSRFEPARARKPMWLLAAFGVLVAFGGGAYAFGTSRTPIAPVVPIVSASSSAAPPSSAAAVDDDEPVIELEPPVADGGRRARPAGTKPAPKKPNCSTPYVIDSSGRTVWRRECFKK